jgi:GNAT superfamily N-acetyltransferase
MEESNYYCVEMEIKQYEPWMREQVVALFALEYGVTPEAFSELFASFYEHTFQASKGIRIVAVEGEQVGGFQSFFYWPVQQNGEVKYTLQSGNSLVHPDFRGKGLFAKMLDYIHQPENAIPFDFLIGFPVEASYNSFIRKNWQNPFNLQWYVRPLKPLFSLISHPEKDHQTPLFQRKVSSIVQPKHITAVAQLEEFDQYRFAYQKDALFRYTFSEGNEQVLFELKAQRRKKFIREIIIGKIVCTNTDASFLQKAMKALIKDINKTTSATLLSIACNSSNPELQALLQAFQFKPIDKKIYFIAKANSTIEADWKNWWFFRGDIDTW